MAKEHKLDIFELLNAIDKRQMNFYSSLEPDIQKAFAGRVALRWTSAVTGDLSAQYLLLSNEIANINFDDLREHPELQYKLLAACGNGRPVRHQWVPMPSQGKTTPKLQNYISQYHPLASISEIDMLVDKFTRESFVEFLQDTGCSEKETKELIDAFEKQRGIVPSVPEKKKRK